MSIRSDLLLLIKDLKTVSYKISEELPFSTSGNPLYLKNPKKIYVDNDTSTVDVLIPIMKGFNIDIEVKTVRIFFANDAKQIPPDYYQLVKDLRNIKNLVTNDNYFKRDCVVDVSYENDIMLTTIELKFTKIYQE